MMATQGFPGMEYHQYQDHIGQRQRKEFGMNQMQSNGLHVVTPHTGHADFEGEPLVLNLQQNGAHPMFPVLNNSMMHSQNEFQANHHQMPRHNPPLDAKNERGQKRSREELNLKEKKRMFKLNERIQQLKDMLDEAGVASKKNKQSILDNTTYYLNMLRNDLLIAKQKAERAEKLVAELKAGNSSDGSEDTKYRKSFEHSDLASVILKVDGSLVAYNGKFNRLSGYSQEQLNESNLLLSTISSSSRKAMDQIQLIANGNEIKPQWENCSMGNGIRNCRVFISPIKGSSGIVEAVQCTLLPIEDLQLDQLPAEMKPMPNNS